MTQDERIKATANRVGLNTPFEYDPAAPRPIPSGEEAAEGMRAYLDKRPPSWTQ